jgi:hypothetical protein
MASETKTGKSGADTDTASRAGAEEALKPFQDAAVKFLKANSSAQEAFMKQRAQACLDFQDQVRKVEQEAFQAVADLTRRHLGAGGQAGSPQAGADYETQVRKVYTDAQARMMAVHQKAHADGLSGDAVKSYATQRHGAYQSFLSDLHQAWTGAKSLDPYTMNSIASSILLTMNAAG